MVTTDRTLDLEGAESPQVERNAPVPHLLLALECDRPASLSTRHRLGSGGRVVLGRGDSRLFRRRDDHRGTDLELRVPDRRMSAAHARIDGALGKWTLTDADSRNGVYVNGIKVGEHVLKDGDLIELGHTLFLFRELEAFDVPDDIDVGAVVPAAHGLCTLNPRLRADFRKLVQLAAANVPVLLLGETGTGKDVAAQALHELSKAEGKFVGVNCGAIPESLMESELFGSAKGSFSGAVRDRPGLVRDAHRGTLFLDEVGDLPLASQAALLRVLQERRVRPVGGTDSVAVDFRLISATNQDIDELVRTSRFRHDLYARIAGFRLHLPPLRERREDLGILVGTLLRRIAGSYANTLTLSQEAARRLYDYDFPLNVRELENWLTAAVALAEGGHIQREHLPEIVPVDLRESFPADGKASSAPPKPLTDEQEEHRTMVIELLREHRGNVSAVARATGKARNQIQRWLKRYALNPDDYR